jgi:hypothetical protein
MSRIRLSLLFVVTVGLSSCIGLAAGTYGKQQMAREQFGLADTRNEFTFAPPEHGYSQAEVIAKWGTPDERFEEDRCEVLSYEDGTSWVGAGIFIGIAPVPMVVPSGKYRNRIYFRGGRTVGLVQEYGEATRVVGVTCGSNECAGAAGRVNEPEIDAKSAVEDWCKNGG